VTPVRHFVYGFEGRGGRYVILDTSSAADARDLRDVRRASGFKTAVFESDRELPAEELDRIADLEDRFGPKPS
jgi:hypothetical protein